MVNDTQKVLDLVYAERLRQVKKWGIQNHPDGTGRGLYDTRTADAARLACDTAFAEGHCTWQHILQEEFFEAIETTNVDDLKKELVQVAAVVVAWVEAINRR